MAESKKPRKRGAPRKPPHSATTAVVTSTTLEDPKSIQLSKTQKKEYLQQKIRQLMTLDFRQITARFDTVVETVKNGGTLKQAAFAGGMSAEELRILLDFGRFGGSEHWQAFYEEFCQAKSGHDISVMKNLQDCAKLGEKWAIERLMNLSDPEDFGSFDVESTLPAKPAYAGIDLVLTIQEKFEEKDIVDAEIVTDAN